MTPLDGVRHAPAAGGPPRQLVILCHGIGADGRDLDPLAQHLAEAVPHATFLAPDAPQPYDEAPKGRQWFSLHDESPRALQAGADRAAPALDATIASELQRLSLPPTAYALVGFSQGATMALYTGLRRRPPPRAIIGFSGSMVADPGIALNATPVLLVHGEQDDIVPPECSHQAEQILRAAGVPVQAAFRPHVGHTIDYTGLQLAKAMLARAFIRVS